MKSLNVITTLAAVATIGCATAAKKQPNIVVLFADDISARDFPIYGSDTWSDLLGGNTQDPSLRATTPVIDKISQMGCWMSTCFGATVSSPSRAQMMTGRFATQTKWWHNGDVGSYVNEQGKQEKYPLFASSPWMIGKVAQEAGYASYWGGKTQMPHCEDAKSYGFDEGCYTPGELSWDAPYTNFTMTKDKESKLYKIVDSGKIVDTYMQTSYYWQPAVQVINDPRASKSPQPWPITEEDKKSYGLNTYGPDVIQDHIFDFMERKVKEKKPLFIYHTTHLGHAAFNFIDQDNTSTYWPATPKVTWDGKKYTRTEPNITGANGKYDSHGSLAPVGMHSMITYIDYMVWRYLEEFKKLGIENNTIFIISADNGTAKYGKGSPESQKGVHVPMMIYAPCLKMTKKGEQDILVSMTDVVPTIADIVGVELPKDYKLDGVSLLPYLTTKSTEHREWTYSYKSNQQIIRSKNLLRDGLGKWYDVSKYPSDLISFPVITDWDSVSAEYKAEKAMLEGHLKELDTYMTEYNGPGGTATPKAVKTQKEKAKKQAAAKAKKQAAAKKNKK